MAALVFLGASALAGVLLGKAVVLTAQVVWASLTRRRTT